MKILKKTCGLLLRRYRWQILLLVVSISLTLIWFWSGKQLATGEEGFAVFNNQKLIDQINFWQKSGTGYPAPFYLNRLALLIFVKSLMSMNLQMVIIQAVFYFVVILTGLVSLYYFQKYVLEKVEDHFLVISCLFYLFNLYGMTQIWGRFLYAHMIIWAYLPLFLLLLIRWLREGTLNVFLIFVIGNFVFSPALGQPAFVLTLWVPATLFGVLEIWRVRHDARNIFLLFLRSLVFLFSWVISNIWWLLPNWLLSSSSFAERGNLKSNLDILVSVSQYFRSGDILLLRQKFLLGGGSAFFGYYSNGWVYLVSILVLVIAIIGLWASRKIKNWLFLVLLAVLGWFVSKGSNIPFGLPAFEFLFKNFDLAQSLRNSYEKFGFVWILPYAIFFGLGLKLIYQKVKKNVGRLLIGCILFLACFVLVWPMWTGSVFARSTRVLVPEYYKQANDFLNQDSESGRILMLPIVPGDGVYYQWGYQGIELSEFLFDKPAVSKILRAKYFDEKYLDLYHKFIGKGDYSKVFNEMDIKYLVLHNDIVSEASGASSSAQVKKILDSNTNVYFLKNFGGLEIYEYVGNKYPGLFVANSEVPPLISYKKQGSTRYVVSIKGASAPFDLIFKETFDNLWEARLDGKKIESHFLAYNYANAWRIDKKGDYTIEIVFKVWPWE